MKTKPKIFQAAIAGVLLALSGCATSPHSTGAWEYRVVEGWTSQRENFEKRDDDKPNQASPQQTMPKTAPGAIQAAATGSSLKGILDKLKVAHSSSCKVL